VARDVAKEKPNAEFMVRLTTFVSLAFLALFWSGSAAALNPDLSLKQLLHTAWGPRDGAPLGLISSLAQTNDGYLWMVGSAGLYRFDGIAFERMELPYSPKLSSLRVRSVFAARDGSVWIGFTFGGVARLKDGRWQVYSPDEGVPAGSPDGFSEAPDGTLWVAASGGIGRFDGLRWSIIGPEMGLPPHPYRFPSVSVDGQGAIWVGTSDEILSRHADEPQFHRFRYVLPTPHNVWYRAGIIWLLQESPNQLVPIGQNPPPATVGSLTDVRGPLVVDRDGGLWFYFDGSLRRLTHPERAVVGVPLPTDDITDAYSKADGLTGLPHAVLPDREGNVWIGTSAGLDRFSEPRLEAIPQSSRDQKCLHSGASVGMAPTGEVDSLWVTNADNLVCLYKSSHWTPLLKQQVSCIFRADNGAVWFGGPKGLWRQQAGHLESVPLPVVGFPVQAMAMDKSGGLWVSIMRTGVFRMKDGAWTPSGGVPALPPGPAITIVRDPHDRLWFSYPGGTVAVLDGDQVHTSGKSDGLHIGNVLANQAGRNEQWLGGELGLARFDGQHFYTVPTAPELPLGSITGIAESTQGDLWLNTPAGIVHLEARELDKNRLNSSYRVKGETIGAFDGLVEGASDIRPLPTIVQNGDGKLWFSTTGGIYALDPLHGGPL
jgi:ligand-binding sensor domain-containing protein